MAFTYRYDVKPTPRQIIELYDNCDLPRPIKDEARIGKMYEHSNLVITAWDNALLIGVARSITDFSWSCYLADLAVRKEYQKSGVGRALIKLTKEHVGEQSMVLLLSVPEAFEYYPRVGFKKHDRSFFINRSE
jgi:GNAT superfamily N-acetyltransferase